MYLKLGFALSSKHEVPFDFELYNAKLNERCKSLKQIYMKLHMMFATKGQSETISLLVLSLIRIKLRTTDPLKHHFRWELLNNIGVMKTKNTTNFTSNYEEF